jgi:hypothetical protein
VYNFARRVLAKEMPSILYEHAFWINMDLMKWFEVTPDVLACIVVDETSFCTVEGL